MTTPYRSYVQNSSMNKQETTAIHSSSQQGVNSFNQRESLSTTDQLARSHSHPPAEPCIDDSKRWHTSPVNRMCASTVPQELWTDPGSTIQGWWLQVFDSLIKSLLSALWLVDDSAAVSLRYVLTRDRMTTFCVFQLVPSVVLPCHLMVGACALMDIANLKT